MEKNTTQIHPLIAHLESLLERDDRAALAALRRGLGHGFAVPEMYPHVVPFLPGDGRKQGYYFLVASLFAVHPEKAAPRGESMGRVFARIGAATRNAESAERRFVALLAAHPDDIGAHLRHAVSLAKSRGVPVDYDRLLRDLLHWARSDRAVQLRWARDFWHPASRAWEDVETPEGEPTRSTE